MHRTAIANPYLMQQAPSHLTPIDIHVNGQRATCHRCGQVPVKVVASFFLGRIVTNRYDENGEPIDEPVKIRLCSRCNSVIQPPALWKPEPKQKPKPKPEERVNPNVLALLALLVDGERDGKVLAEVLGVTQPTVWTYLRELVRMDCIKINKEGYYASLRLTEVTAEGRRRLGVEMKS